MNRQLGWEKKCSMLFQGICWISPSSAHRGEYRSQKTARYSAIAGHKYDDKAQAQILIAAVI